MSNLYKQYDLEYHKKFQRQISLCINRKTEPDLLEWLEMQPNIQGYIKTLIRNDMAENGFHHTPPLRIKGQLMVDDDGRIVEI